MKKKPICNRCEQPIERHRDGWRYNFLQFHYDCPSKINTTKTATEVKMQQQVFKVRADAMQEELNRTIDKLVKECLGIWNLPQPKQEPTKMTKPTPAPSTNVKHQQEIINAYLEKKVIQFWDGGRWVSVNSGQSNFSFNFGTYAWRIQPEPREFMMILSAEGTVVACAPQIPDENFPRHRGFFPIKVREVLED